MQNKLNDLLLESDDRFTFWANFINEYGLRSIVEIGVYRGEFTEYILKHCPSIQKYYLIDPWRHLNGWNKPANTTDNEFNNFFKETIERTSFASSKLIILRGMTIDVIHNIPDDSVDLIYVDGDHTLKGITIDLLNAWNKAKSLGFVAGDDFTPTIWQHSNRFEPSLIFPFAKYFAEALNKSIYGLPFNQFVISKSSNKYEFFDLNQGQYKNDSLLEQLQDFKNLGKGKGIGSFLKKAMLIFYSKVIK